MKVNKPCLYFAFIRIKLKVSNTVRWRQDLDDDGNAMKESNARIVKWSDGSMSLHLGSEIFDVYKQPLQGDHNHLFIRQGTGLQGQAVFRTKLTFRPYSTESFTHKKMTMSLADRSQKTSGIKILTQVGHDPDANRYAKLKKEEEQLRAAMRQKATTAKTKRNRESGNLNNYREEHDSDDEGAISIAAIKNKFKDKSGGANTSKQGMYSAIYSTTEFIQWNFNHFVLFVFSLQDPEFIHRTKTILTLTQDARKRPINRKHCNWPIQMKRVVVDRTKMQVVIMMNLVVVAVAVDQVVVLVRALALDLGRNNKKFLNF